MENSFSSTLKQLRVERKVTQEELAEAIGVSFSSINSYEIGRRLPGNATLIKLANYFGVKVDHLFEQKVIDERRKLASCVEPAPVAPLRR